MMPAMHQPEAQPAAAMGVAVEPRWRRVARALNPFTLVFNPVFHREMRSTSRSTWTFYNRMVVMLVLLLVAGLTYWGVAGRAGAGTSGVERIEALQRIAPELFTPLAWIQFAVIVFIAQSLTAPAINQERQRRSFPTLAVSPLTAGQIVFGTLAARMTQVLILSLVLVPVLLALRVFGGLDTATILNVAMLTLATGLLSGAFGILASVLSARPSGASALALGMMVLVCAGPPLVFAAWFKMTNSSLSLSWILLSPFVAFLTTTYGMVGGAPAAAVAWVPLAASGIYVGMALAVCLVATSLVRPLILREAVSDGPKAAPRRARRTAPPPAALSGPPAEGQPDAGVPIIHEHSREVSDRPVLWRELRQTVFRSPRRRAIVITLMVLGLAWVHWTYKPGSEETVIGLTMALTVMFLITATTAGSASITGEVEARTWPVLLTTPLSPHQVLLSKIAGTLRRLWIAPVVVLGVQLIGVMAGNVHVLLLPITALAMAGAAVLLASTGVVFSLMSRKTSSASAFNLLFAGMLWIGSLVAIGIVSSIIGVRSEPAAFGLALALNPVALVGIATEALVDNGGHFHPQRLGLPGLDPRMGPFGFSCVVAIFVMVCVAFSWLIVSLGAAHWDRFTARRLG